MRREYLYGVVGLALGVVAALLFTLIISPKSALTEQEKALDTNSHAMTDGAITSNSHTGMTMDDMVSNLVDKSGDEFDKAFLEGMIGHHVGAVDMAKLVFDNAKHIELKDMATDIIDAQTLEIEMMKKWQKEWGYKK